MFKFRNKTIDCGLYLSKVSNKNARTVLMDLVLMFHFLTLNTFFLTEDSFC